MYFNFFYFITMDRSTCYMTSVVYLHILIHTCNHLRERKFKFNYLCYINFYIIK